MTISPGESRSEDLSMVIALLIVLLVQLGLPAMSVTLLALIFVIILPSLLAVVVTSNVVSLYGATSSILIQVCPGAVPTKSISSQVKVLVFIASEKVTKNFPVIDVVREDCPLARSIVAMGLVASKSQEIGQKYHASVFPSQLLMLWKSSTKVSLNKALFVQEYCTLLRVHGVKAKAELPVLKDHGRYELLTLGDQLVIQEFAVAKPKPYIREGLGSQRVHW
jgi:hypothetical protein